MRVLLAHQGDPWRATGGSEVYVAALARELAQDHEVALLYRSEEADAALGPRAEPERDGVRVFALGGRGRERPGFEAYRDPSLAAAAADLIGRLRPDVVHVNHLNGLSTGLVSAARRLGAAVVITLHDFATLCPLGQLLDLRLRVCPGPSPRRCLGCVGEQALAGAARPERAQAGPVGVARLLARLSGRASGRIARRLEEMLEALRAADLLVAPSLFLRDRLAALGVPGIAVLANGHPGFEPRPRRPDPEGRVRFGYLGSLIPSKGVHLLAEAFRALGEPRARLRIHGGFVPYHGDCGYEPRLRRALGPLAEDAIRGPFPRAELGEVLADLDVVVLPSLWEENAPLAVQEAFLARLPVIVSGHGGLAEMVRDGVDGLHFEPGSVAGLAGAMRRLLDQPELRLRLGASPPPVPGMREHAAAVARLYAQASEGRRARPGRVGAVVVDRGGGEDAARAIDSLRDGDVSPEIVLVENGTGEPPPLPEGVTVLRLAENRGFAAGANAGLARLAERGCDRFLLLNNDAVLEPGALRRLAEALDDPGLAAVAPVVLREADGRTESRGARFSPRSGRFRLLDHGAPHEPAEGRRAADVLPGVALLLSRRALEIVGPLEEGYFHSFEDVDWCLRARARGLRLAVVLGARARHRGSRTLGAGSPDRLYYAARNHLRAAERTLPAGGAARVLRSASILALNLAHAMVQPVVPRLEGLRAVLAGARDFGQGRAGPRVPAGG